MQRGRGRYYRSKGHRYERSDRTLRSGLLALLGARGRYKEPFPEANNAEVRALQ